jgi:polysaccharide pyruvyl transferase WcaK-like protein
MSRVVLLHAYSRVNRGDGLLVDLSVDVLADAGIKAEHVTVVALDHGSFAGSEFGVAPAGLPEVTGRLGLIGGALIGRKKLRRLIRDSELVIGVGGGYLRSGTQKEALGTLLAHLPQLTTAVREKRPSQIVYLPQSVGPLKGPVGSLIAKNLKRSQLFLRDDRSMIEVPTATRMPDLAVLAIAERGPTLGVGSRVVIVPRSVRSDRYIAALHRLRELLPEAVWAIQSAGRGNDDATFMDGLFGRQERPRVQDVLEEAGAVVSVRLHGALEAVLQGVPAIHLSYERKGFGAYGDLGLTDWLHQAKAFDPVLVAAQARALLSNSEHYWEEFVKSIPALRRRRLQMVETVAKSLRSG